MWYFGKYDEAGGGITLYILFIGGLYASGGECTGVGGRREPK